MVESANPVQNPTTRRTPRQRVLGVAARVTWLLVALAALALFAAGLPVWLAAEQAQYRTQFGFWDLRRNAAGDVVVDAVPGEQAARAGVMNGDVLVSIDGRPPAPEAALTEAALFPRGEAGTPLTFAVRTGDRPPREVTVTRGAAEGLALARLGVPTDAFIAFTAGIELFKAAVFVAIAGLIFWKRGGERVAWLSSLMLIAVFVGGISAPVLALVETRPAWAQPLDLWFSLVLGLMVLFLSLFPSGRPVPGWTRFYMLAWLIWAAAAWFAPALYFWRQDTAPFLLAALAWLGVGIAAQVWRYRTDSTTRQRQQTKWVVWGTGLALLAGVLGQFALEQLLPSDFLYDLLYLPAGRLLQLLIPLTLAVAIWRYKLWDIDRLINRTLVYGSLTALTIAAYILIVGGLGALFQSQSSAVSGLIATGLIAVLFQPVRERLQRGVNRLLYGERDDPAAVLTRLAHHLERAETPADILPNLTRTIALMLKIPHAAIWLPDGDGQLAPVAAWGRAPDQVERIPLTYQQQTSGHLAVAPRAPGERFTAQEHQLLAAIAALTAGTVRAVKLSDELSRSRRRIVAAREEERRRLRRDLHDGLGPQLASQTLALEAIDQLMADQPEKARRLLASLKQQAKEAILDVRRLVYDLRPPALDDLGLVGALQQSASRLETGELRFTFEVDAPLPALPAAVETAVYRIAQEAMTNVARHAQAGAATVRLTWSASEMVVEVRDDGRGLPAGHRSGVGLQSMGERAAELNGHCLVESLPEGGTLVRATLPLEVYDE